MTIQLPALLRDVRGLWARDRAILAPLSGLLTFLPQYAVLLLLPPVPPAGQGQSIEQWGRALEPWIATYGGWYVVASLIAQFGALAVVACYGAPDRTVGAAMGHAARLFPRSLLATMLVTVPCLMAVIVALPVPVVPLLVVPGVVYILARTALVDPVILGEGRTSAVAAIRWSWRLTRGQGLKLALLLGAIMLGGRTLGAVLVAVERGLRDGGFGNPVAVAIVDAGAAGAAWAAALALALVQVAAYRRLAR